MNALNAYPCTLAGTLFVAVVLLVAGCREAGPERTAAGLPERPNIIYILADDLGYGELGSYGQTKIRTPHLDRLAAEGMRFTQHYSGSPVCAPSRAALLTGLHTGHALVRDNYELGGFHDDEERGQLPLRPGTETLGTMLQARGYTTAAIGKGGLGGPGSTGVPNEQGFDLFYGYLDQKQAHNYYPTHLWRDAAWDTLIFFSSDNGPTFAGGAEPAFFESAGPFRGLKTEVYEGGIRVPFVAWWPGVIEAGTTSDHVSAFWDVVPAVADLTGATAPEGLDGISFLPTLRGEEAAQPQHDYLYWEYHGRWDGAQAVRLGRWKGMRLGGHVDPEAPIELYDLETDPAEQHDVAGRHPDVVRRIRAIMESRAPSEIEQWNFRSAGKEG